MIAAAELNGAFANGERAALVPLGRLEDLAAGIARFREAEELNGFQRWIVGEMYDFAPPSGFPARSVIVVAIPRPLCADMEFAAGGRMYRCLSLVSSDVARAEASLRSALPETARIEAADRLPLKRLAASCGLARYGRNNVCYVPGMGSSLLLKAYFCDLGCEEGAWGEPAAAPECAGCGRCVADCPTGAIRKDRFLIDNERCLSALNESAAPFPDWLPEDVHHTAYDCLRCQEACPMNAALKDSKGAAVGFDEDETAILLSGAEPGSWPPALAAKARLLELDRWPDGLARNLRAIMRKEDGAAAR